MEFNFETPLILNLRKMAGKPLTLVLSVFSFLLAAGFGIYLVKSISIVYAVLAAICLLMSISFLAVFCSLKRCNRTLGGSAFSFGAFVCVLSAAALVAVYVFLNDKFLNIVARFIKNLSGIVGMPSFEYYAEVGAVVGIIWFISAFFMFAAAKSTASKNYPHKVCAIFTAIISFVLVAGILAGCITLLAFDGYKYFIIDNSHIYYSVMTVLIFINLLLGGLFALNLVKANGVK